MQNRTKTLTPRNLILHPAIYLLIMGIALADYLIGDLLSLYLLYIFPIIYLGLYSTRFQSILAALISCLLWIFVDFKLGYFTNGYMYSTIEFFSRLIIFESIAFSVSAYQQAYKALELQAFHDEKTGAYNYRAFLEVGYKELELAQRAEKVASLAYFDMDNFKSVNDNLGHVKGDEVLKIFSQIVSDSIRSSDLFARIGGDEFVVLFIGSTPQQSLPILSKIQKEFNETMKKDGHMTTVSIGVISTGNEKDLDKLTNAADLLMYQAKEEGKNKIITERN